MIIEELIPKGAEEIYKYFKKYSFPIEREKEYNAFDLGLPLLDNPDILMNSANNIAGKGKVVKREKSRILLDYLTYDKKVIIIPRHYSTERVIVRFRWDVVFEVVVFDLITRAADSYYEDLPF